MKCLSTPILKKQDLVPYNLSTYAPKLADIFWNKFDSSFVYETGTFM